MHSKIEDLLYTALSNDKYSNAFFIKNNLHAFANTPPTICLPHYLKT